ncbi:hypothetical protein THRCLA_05242 [Thraustotheca clavata]|uniref:Transmembrane protein n=1 Tax=Thraustotheca clavata TaxID=74557 RepID=A0A1V9ZX61_9STRA|nr:hypothetical protein THRCLA_05242 [Thraustotheca clavata]
MDVLVPSTCAQDYVMYQIYVEKYMPDVSEFVNGTLDAIQSLDINLVQFTSADTNSPISLTLQPLLVPDNPNWSFYSWAYLYQWVTGSREVVSFQGDRGIITTMSTSNQALTMSPSPSKYHKRFHFLGCVMYITGVLMLTAAIVMNITIFSRGEGEFINVFELNRVVRHVWIGRSLLFVRRTAIWLLNTSTLQLTLVGAVTQFISSRLSWFTTILASAECTWFVYILNDILSFRRYNAHHCARQRVHFLHGQVLQFGQQYDLKIIALS